MSSIKLILCDLTVQKRNSNMTSDVNRSKQWIELKMFQFTFLSLMYTLNDCIWVNFCLTYLNPFIILH